MSSLSLKLLFGLLNVLKKKELLPRGTTHVLHVALLLALDTVAKECVYCDTYHLEVCLILLLKV